MGTPRRQGWRPQGRLVALCAGLIDTGCILVECSLPAEDGAALCAECREHGRLVKIHGRSVRMLHGGQEGREGGV